MAALWYPLAPGNNHSLATNRISMPLFQGFSLSPTGRAQTVCLLGAMVCALALVFVSLEGRASAKRNRGPTKEPDLKILSVALSPTPYSPQDDSLDLTIQVRLPKELNGSTILEVSSLISSPSKRSMRFLSKRQPVDPASASDGQAPSSPVAPQSGADGQGSASSQLIEVTLTWDGTDQMKQVVGRGEYRYEVRAKLLSADENGVRTQMVSWPKRGVLKVK